MSSEPVYNIRRGAVEATIKSPLFNAEFFAREIFQQLKQKGYIDKNASFSSYQNILLGIIHDQDNDGHLDIKIDDLVKALGVKLSQNNRPKLEQALSESPLMDTYFKDQVSVSFTPTPSPLSHMSLAEALQYFRTRYGTHLDWDDNRTQQFLSDLKTFMESHFVDVPVETVAEAQNAVNDQISAGDITDQDLSQFSRDRQGRFRVDCGVYANVYAQIFKACRFETGYGYAVQELPGGNLGGHLFAIGIMRNGDILINNNQAIIQTNSNNSIFDVLKKTNPSETYLSIVMGNSQSEAINNANQGPVGTIRLFNRTLQLLGEKMKLMVALCTQGEETLVERVHMGTLGGISEEAARSAIQNERSNCIEHINNILDTLDSMLGYAARMGRNEEVSYNGRMLRKEEILRFGKHLRNVLIAYRETLENRGTPSSLQGVLKAAKEYFSQYNEGNQKHPLYHLTDSITIGTRST